MLRLLAAVICLGLGGPVLAASPADMTGPGQDAPRAAPRTEGPREDAADIWLRESAPPPGSRR